MSQETHEQARKLIVLAGVEDLSGREQTWLRAHLHDCAACSDYAEATGRAVRAVRSQPLAADFALVRATQKRVRLRAAELRQQQERIWLVCLSCLSVGISTAVTTPLLWRAFEWVGLRAGVSHWVWQAGFTYFWVVPALVVSLVLMARSVDLKDNGERHGI
jgi:predicted anti-sigma-YlaC factor YlaD